jgi:gamma-glutamyl-gamma-aminobutyrate hydrolase PuuD
MITGIEQKKLAQDATMREVYDLRVLVVGGGFQYLKMFFDAGMKGSTCVEDADIICFTGGADVDPVYYGEKAIPQTYSTPERDARESIIYATALGLKKAMIGICRGGQFLNVMNGGKLWQDVSNHGGVKHSVIHMPTGEAKHNMTSTHHQQMIPAKDGIVLALAELCLMKRSEDERMVREKPELDDVEVVWYPDSLCLCFQPHPEFDHGDCRNYFLDLVDEYILPAC